MALKLLPEDLSDVPPHLADRYEAQAGKYWDMFYRRNTTKFFKDRHYLHKEFPDLAAGPATLLEVGCGVGNTVFPLLEINPALRVHCCDFAASAIELVRSNPAYGVSRAEGGAVHGFVADITRDYLAAPAAPALGPLAQPGPYGGCGVPEAGCDMATMIFVLSAIHPQRMAAAVHNVARCLRPGGGRLLFRDYAEGDLAQERLAGGDRPKRLGHNFYVRGDGTRCYYFGQEEVVALFASAGFACDAVTLHERTVVNHKRDIAMDRRWLQIIFTLREYVPPPLPLRQLLDMPPPLHATAAAAAAATAAAANAAHGAQGRARSSGGGGAMDVDEADGSAVGGGGAEAVAGAAGAAVADALPGGLTPGSWLTGAAGRLASHLAAGPGLPSGRALLPDSLDAADDLRAELSPSRHGSSSSTGGGADGGCSSSGAHHPHHHQHHHGQPPQRSPLSGGLAVGPGSAGRGGGSGAQAVVGTAGRGAAAGAAAAPEEDVMQVDGAAGRSLERELEAEFFATIGRNSAEVVAEEVAAAGAALSRVRLVDVADVAAARLAAAAAAAAGAGQQQQGQVVPAVACEVEAEVEVATGVSFSCLLRPDLAAGALVAPPAELALARLLAASPRLLNGRCALQLGPAAVAAAAAAGLAAAQGLGQPGFGSNISAAAAQPPRCCGVLPAMAAVRGGGCRRVVVTDSCREGLAAAAGDLRRNAHRLVIERLRLAALDWAALGSTASTAGTAATGAAGYTFVTGAVRQLRDVMQLQPNGYEVVYAADPLAAVAQATGSSSGGGEAGADVAVAAARGLFEAAAQLLQGSSSSSSGGGHGGCSSGAGRLLLVVVPGAWAAAHGMGFAALAAVCGWELLTPEQLAEGWGLDTAPALATGGCAAMGFRRSRQ
ncbi:hypothetical protein HXX76_013718 [Chlamydomonas incerta]|uniref:Methyltransferase type 12 domain-containing protein n=1 Tax=Chlamydomonas incerta TaxID=51695 RepID=A0A835SNP7_CHLIN|nr:hypothetical protein HXX76_013718 [Chlamydomonas incerta]|eukprot:KAG2425509.1 hypothetical protein HXX76_013718 [Chlamydomonas incerta]